MSDSKENRKLEMDLVTMLARSFPGLTVEVGHSDRWDRMCVTFRWPGFAGLLPEERFQRLVCVIPEQYRQTRLDGFIWLELAPGETIDDFLREPRSEDMADKEASIHAELVRISFFDALREALGSSPKTACTGGFAKSVEVLVAKQYSDLKIRDARLVFIRHGAYCDCQVLESVRAALTEGQAGAA